MISYHISEKGKIAELLPESGIISRPEEILDVMAEAGYNDAASMIIHEKNLPEEFFNLRTRVAGEILQKFSNYRMRLAIIGDFSDVNSNSLRDFIRESNRGGTIFFVSSINEALCKLKP
jgi:hypothetical protein